MVTSRFELEQFSQSIEINSEYFALLHPWNSCYLVPFPPSPLTPTILSLSGKNTNQSQIGSQPRVTVYTGVSICNLYNMSNYSLILIGFYLWSIGNGRVNDVINISILFLSFIIQTGFDICSTDLVATGLVTFKIY